MRHTLLTAKEEKALLAAAGRGSRSAVAKLVEHNQALVTRIARRYFLAAGYQTMEDLIQWGNMGLLRAIAKWDGREGRFSTYATYWIRAFVRRHSSSHGTAFSMSSRDGLYLARVCQARSHLLKTMQREPGPEEIACRAELPVSVIVRSLAVLEKQVEIDGDLAARSENGRGRSEPFIEVIETDNPSTESEAEGRVLIEQIRAALQNLTPVQRTVITRRYLNGEPAPLKDLSRELGVSAQYVSIIERQALTALRALIGSIELS